MEKENKKQEEAPAENAGAAQKKSVRHRLSGKKFRIVLVLALLLLVTGGSAYVWRKNDLRKKEAAVREKTEKFIKENLVQPGTDLKIADFQREGDLYKMTVSMGTQKITSYVTMDGKKFFPQVIELDQKLAAGKDPSQDKPSATEAAEKKAVPQVELFVMSYCPYGLQAEKGILPAVKKLGSKIDFRIKFVDYIMHGKKEADENTNQYCIQKEEPAKLSGYLECFAKDGDAAKCLASAKIDKAKVSACAAATDKEFKITETANSGGQTPAFDVNKKENDAYGVKGSPTLVVNGTVIDSQRDPDSFLKAVCSGFADKPAECGVSISSAAPAAGFGDGQSSEAAAGASCGQ